MPSSTGELLDTLVRNGFARDSRPWGIMMSVHSVDHDLHVKYITVAEGKRTSLQYHRYKDELLIMLVGMGFVEVDGRIQSVRDGHCVRIPPGVQHRVTGPLSYLEVSTYDDDTDTIRIEDDFGRAP